MSDNDTLMNFAQTLGLLTASLDAIEKNTTAQSRKIESLEKSIAEIKVGVGTAKGVIWAGKIFWLALQSGVIFSVVKLAG